MSLGGVGAAPSLPGATLHVPWVLRGPGWVLGHGIPWVATAPLAQPPAVPPGTLGTAQGMCLSPCGARLSHQLWRKCSLPSQNTTRPLPAKDIAAWVAPQLPEPLGEAGPSVGTMPLGAGPCGDLATHRAGAGSPQGWSSLGVPMPGTANPPPTSPRTWDGVTESQQHPWATTGHQGVCLSPTNWSHLRARTMAQPRVGGSWVGRVWHRDDTRVAPVTGWARGGTGVAPGTGWARGGTGLA